MIARVIIEVGFSAPTTGAYLHLDDEGRGRLDTATLGPDGLWVDVTRWAQQIDTRQGATRGDGPTLRYEAGTATIVLNNNDRRFDPTNLDGPYVVAGVTQVEPLRAVRVRAEYTDPDTDETVTVPIWRGLLLDVQVSYQGPNAAVATFTCTDGFAVFTAQDRAASVSAGAGEDTGARINRILDAADWPASDRAIDTGDSTVQATTLDGVTLSEMQLVADSELGELWMGVDGLVRFRRRLGIYADDRSNTSQATFGGVPPELPYSDVQIGYDAQSIYNVVSVGRVGGTPQTVEDSASKSAYLPRAFRRTDLLLETDAECLEYARSLLLQSSQPELRFTSMTIKPRRDDRLWPAVLGRLLGDRVTVIRRPPGGGDPIERDVYIRGIEHHITPGVDWTVQWVFQSATRRGFLVLDHPTLGQLDNNGLAY